MWVLIFFFGMRVVFGLGACHLFPQCVLAVIPLMGVCRYMSHVHAQRKEEAAVGSHLWVPWQKSLSACIPREAGAVFGFGSWTLGVGGPHTLLGRWGQCPAPTHRTVSDSSRLHLPLGSKMAVAAHVCPCSLYRWCPAT